MKFTVSLTIDAPDDIKTLYQIEKLVEHYMRAAGCSTENISVSPKDLKIAAPVNSDETLVRDHPDMAEWSY